MSPVLLPPRLSGFDVSESPPLDPEALIKEARERQRRRRMRLALAVVAVAVAVVVGYGLFRAQHGTSGLQRSSGGPAVDVRAFAQHGRLAFISRGTLWVLDGGRSSLRRLPRVPGYFAPQSPMFSPDGSWLSYVESDPSGATPSQLWLAHGDGTSPRRIRGVPDARPLGWSPNRDLLAVVTGPRATALRIVRPDGAVRTIVRAGWVYGAAWSPDGAAIAAATGDGHLDFTLRVHTLATNSARTWLSLTPPDRVDGMRGIVFTTAGWWRGVGIGLWVFGDGAIHNNDETPLDVVGAPGRAPRLLGLTLSDGTTDAAAASQRGDVAIVTDHGGGRAAWQDKTLQLCSRGEPCRPLELDPARVTIDPAWSADGTKLAFVEAPNVRTGPWSQRRLAGWFAAHHLAVYDTGTQHIRHLAKAVGATTPVWSPDGRSLLYVKADGLWLLPTLASTPVEIASPLFPRTHWPQYYAQVPWTAQFAWWSR